MDAAVDLTHKSELVLENVLLRQVLCLKQNP